MWITESDSLKRGIQIINQIGNEPSSIIIDYVANKLNVKQSETSDNSDELIKIKNEIKVSDADFKLALQSVKYLLKNSMKYIMKPTELHEHLHEKLHLSEPIANKFIKVWIDNAKTMLDKINKDQLDKVSWELNIQAMTSDQNKQLIPKGVIQLDMVNEFEETDQRNKVTLEMDHQQLYSFYMKLEEIQTQLDEINKSNSL